MKNNATRTIRSEEITIDVRICAALAANRGGEVYLAAIAPDMELTVITLDEAPGILPCFEEDDAYLNLPNTSLLLCYNPAQVLKMGGKHYLTGPVILARTNICSIRRMAIGRSSQSSSTSRPTSFPTSPTPVRARGCCSSVT